MADTTAAPLEPGNDDVKTSTPPESTGVIVIGQCTEHRV